MTSWKQGVVAQRAPPTPIWDSGLRIDKPENNTRSDLQKIYFPGSSTTNQLSSIRSQPTSVTYPLRNSSQEDLAFLHRQLRPFSDYSYTIPTQTQLENRNPTQVKKKAPPSPPQLTFQQISTPNVSNRPPNNKPHSPKIPSQHNSRLTNGPSYSSHSVIESPNPICITSQVPPCNQQVPDNTEDLFASIPSTHSGFFTSNSVTAEDSSFAGQDHSSDSLSSLRDTNINNNVDSNKHNQELPLRSLVEAIDNSPNSGTTVALVPAKVGSGSMTWVAIPIDNSVIASGLRARQVSDHLTTPSEDNSMSAGGSLSTICSTQSTDSLSGSDSRVSLQLQNNGVYIPGAEGARCTHVEHWKRLRAKRGCAYFVCYMCGAKWRTPSTCRGPNHFTSVVPSSSNESVRLQSYSMDSIREILKSGEQYKDDTTEAESDPSVVVPNIGPNKKFNDIWDCKLGLLW